MKTYMPKAGEVERKWLLIDAENQVLGRLAARVAQILRGKDKPVFTPHIDCGDFVVVVNADKVALTGRKETRKQYEDFSGYMGGRKLQTADQVRARKPERLIRDAVKGMLPKGTLGRRQLRKLRVFAGPDHTHQAQTPAKIEL